MGYMQRIASKFKNITQQLQKTNWDGQESTISGLSK